MGYAFLILIGLIGVLVHAASPELVPFDLDIIFGLVALAGGGIGTAFTYLRYAKATPAVERLRPDTEQLKDASQEINFLLEDGWGVKRIVDMISANYQLPPKLVYEHVMEIMNSRQDTMERTAHDRIPESDPFHDSKETSGDQDEMVIYYSNNKDD